MIYCICQVLEFPKYCYNSGRTESILASILCSVISPAGRNSSMRFDDEKREKSDTICMQLSCVQREVTAWDRDDCLLFAMCSM